MESEWSIQNIWSGGDSQSFALRGKWVGLWSACMLQGHTAANIISCLSLPAKKRIKSEQIMAEGTAHMWNWLESISYSSCACTDGLQRLTDSECRGKSRIFSVRLTSSYPKGTVFGKKILVMHFLYSLEDWLLLLILDVLYDFPGRQFMHASHASMDPFSIFCQLPITWLNIRFVESSWLWKRRYNCEGIQRNATPPYLPSAA